MAVDSPTSAPPIPVTPETLVNVLGVVYVHRKTSDGGDMYFTRFGLPYADLLAIENWYEHDWFTANRVRLEGTSAVYRVPTRVVGDRSLELVVKNCRVGEDVPLDTHTLEEFINAEFNSPWEEFALVMELDEGKFGPTDLHIHTQEPLAIYVPPEKMQLWQSGRSRDKINRIRARHPGIDIDILRQYKLIYSWIRGLNIIEALQRIGVAEERLPGLLEPATTKAMEDMERKGFVVADMKPAHVIIGEQNLRAIDLMADDHGPSARGKQTQQVESLVHRGLYSVIDYELLLRTKDHEEQVGWSRRHSYLDDVRDRFVATPLPAFLQQVEIMGVPYVHGHVESTGGDLWVMGRNARLFDYFLPERWRKTPSWKLSEGNEVYYTLTKDHIHLVWKTSRVGEKPDADEPAGRAARIEQQGFNSPFEEFAIAHDLSSRGVPTVYLRAIYMTGSTKVEAVVDSGRFESHRGVRSADGAPVLREDRNYITLRGYFNGPDQWVAQAQGQLCRPVDLAQAVAKAFITQEQYDKLYGGVLERLATAGYDGSLLEGNDILVAQDPQGTLLRDAGGEVEVRVANFELIGQEAVTILYQDDDVLALDKPEGLATIPERAPGVDCLLAQAQTAGGAKLFVVHRIDKEASGVVLFARNAAAHRHLCRQFAQRSVGKTYQALLVGTLEAQRGTVDRPLRQFGSGRTAVDLARGKPCVSDYEVAERMPGFTLVRAHPRTGRRHQLRAHFYAIGHPIAGDRRYGAPAAQATPGRLMLHAAAIAFALPSGAPAVVESPLPASFTQALAAARGGPR